MTNEILEGLSSPRDQEYQFPVNYAYDYLNGGAAYLTLPPLNLNRHLQSKRFLGLDKLNIQNESNRSSHAIDIFPIQAGLPWATGILQCRQNKYWQLAIDTARTFLQQCAADELCQTMFKSTKSISEIARRELSAGIEEGWIKFPVYLHSAADRPRAKLLALAHALIFVLDGENAW